MQLLGPCHSCRTPGVRPSYADREWVKKPEGQEFHILLDDVKEIITFDLLSESRNADSPKLENLFPRVDDGRELAVDVTWVDDRRVRLTLYRRPRNAAPSQSSLPPPPATGKPIHKMSLEDLQTFCTEKSVPFEAGWTKNQLVAAITKALAVKQE